MSLYLCLDCGGSKTSAVICDASGTIVGRARSGPSNFAYLGPAAFKSAVELAVSDALKTALDPPSVDPALLPPKEEVFAAAWFGISGVDSDADVAIVTKIVSELLNIPVGDRITVGNDAQLLAAPLHLHSDVRYAVTSIAGTGSNNVSFEKTENGKLRQLGRHGGWGWILGDEGGGFHVGREAIRQILLETDRDSMGGPPPNGKRTLVGKVLSQFGVDDPLELLSPIHFPDPALSIPYGPDAPPYQTIAREKRLSQLSPLVFESAFEDGDPLAINVLGTCADALANQIALLCRTSQEVDEQRPRAIRASESILSFGGSLAGIPKYRNLVLDALKEKGHAFKYIELVIYLKYDEGQVAS